MHLVVVNGMLQGKSCIKVYITLLGFLKIILFYILKVVAGITVNTTFPVMPGHFIAVTLIILTVFQIVIIIVSF